MATLVRPATADDLDWMADTGNEWDSVLGRDFWVRLLSGQVEPILVMLVGEREGRRVGFAGLTAPTSLPYPLLGVVVEPEHRGSGAGADLFAAVRAHFPPGDIGGGLPDDDPRSAAIVRHWGFEELGHGIDSVLVLAGRPPVPPPDASLQVQYVPADSAGAEIDDLIAQAGDYPEGEVYGSRLSNAALVAFAPDVVWAQVRDSSGLLAATAISPLSEEEWYVHFTATAPHARGRGLARLAKEAAHALAESRGARRVRTTNEDRNARMRGLNAALGYVAERGDYRVILRRPMTAG